MQVAVEEEFLLLVQVEEELTRREDGRLVLKGGILVESVKVVAHGIEPVVPAVDTIGVEHRDQDEDEVVS